MSKYIYIKALYNKIINNNFDGKKIGVFISIPRCASKTILKMFELGKNRNNDTSEPRNHFIIYENHQRLCVFEEKYNLDDLFIFTFVRNPYERVI